MLRHKKLIARLFMLTILLSCLGFVALTPNTKIALAAPCCSSCPIPPGQVEPTPQEYCTSQCGASSGSCYNSCISGVYNCWQRCVSCGGGPGGAACFNDFDCPYSAVYGAGSCVNDTCVY